MRVWALFSCEGVNCVTDHNLSLECPLLNYNIHSVPLEELYHMVCLTHW